MRNVILACCVATALVGCDPGGGGSSLPPPVPVSSVNGAAADGLIAHGTIRIYDFSNGTRGALLAETVTDDEGLYELELQTESKPIWVEVTEGSYLEEATGKTVALDPVENENLTAVMNHVAGDPVTIAVTPYTHVAAALARYLITTGDSVVNSIDEANHRVTQWIGVPIAETIPLDITNSSNVSASVTPAHFYGFLSGAISFWTQAHYTNSNDVKLYGCAEYDQCSIDFIQTMYSDMLADGMLDGVGANNISLSFGTTALSPSVYRTDLALAILDVSYMTDENQFGNKTGLTSAQLMLRSRAYAASTDALFAGVPPQSIDAPAISLASPASSSWVRGISNITGTVVDQIGPGNVTLSVDGNVVGSAAANYYAPSISWNSTSVTDGQHDIGLKVTNDAGLVATATVNVVVDNTAPLFTANDDIINSSIKCRVSAVVFDAPNGNVVNLASVSAVIKTYSGSPLYANNYPYYSNSNPTVTSTNTTTILTSGNTFTLDVPYGPQTFTVTDLAGNSTTIETGWLKYCSTSKMYQTGCSEFTVCDSTNYGSEK